MELGAASYSRKAEGREVIDEVLARVSDSIFRRSREVLVVNADAQCRDAIADVLGIEGMNVTSPQSAVEAIEAYRASRFDCVILCAGASEISSQDLLSELQKAAAGEDLRILIFSMEEESVQNLNFTPIREGAVIRKVQNSDRLLAELTRILHIPESALPEYHRLKLEKLRQLDDELAGCKVLIVDDDVRNIFALTSILERHQIQVLHAENGRAGIDTLLQFPDIDVVLMDIMMPGMDGYETIRALREIEALRDLPIVAVTAKAMKGDREKCLESGASDYIAKPVDLDQLFSLMRIWVYERRRKPVSARTSV
jgi:CheY-like chemotaxis protein